MDRKGCEIVIPFQHNDERVKIIKYIVITLLIQCLLIGTFYSVFVNKVNKDIINQNNEIMGKILEENPELAVKIAPIILGKENGNAFLGEGYLGKYSYGYNLKYSDNPLIKTSNTLFYLGLFGIVVISILGVIYFLIKFINPLYKEVNNLSYRAENIIEDKKVDKNSDKYSGSLDKFISKFSLMEDRIDNSIYLLQEEKINLKNIINDISHQLKTPLMALTMYNEILTEYENMDGAEVREFINLSKEQLERMDWLVKTLLKYARLESNVVNYNKEETSLNNTVEESIAPLKIKGDEKHQTISFKANKDIKFLHDRRWISEAISNIIKNAIEHTKEYGRIEVSLYETPITITIEIKDNGEGIEREEQKKIFNRFYKGESSINPTSIGIGLCLSMSIVKAHNGNISVDSKVGVGSTFYISFIKNII
ncbi:MAG: sensor histidine kinase [Clostridium sp.]